jgi:hypothetical protein
METMVEVEMWLKPGNPFTCFLCTSLRNSYTRR